MSDAPAADYAVAIIGSGPAGLTLANLLGLEGIPVVLIERNASTVSEPRAVSIDDEALRTMQAIGVINEVAGEIVPGYGSHYYSPGGRCFIRVEPTEQPYGYPRRNAFRQPILESQLRKGLSRFTNVTTLYQHQLLSFAQDSEGVTLSVRDPQDVVRALRCRYLVGCDGASSTVREQLQISLEGATFGERWLIVDVENNPNPAPHTKVFCDPKRPCITLPGPRNTRRFEFKLHPHESDAQFTAPAMVEQLIRTHGVDPHCTIRRIAVYRFHARSAQRWSEGRVFLVGDAAHLTPPFAGQGMNSGVRDSHNLAWKLAAVLRNEAGPGLLDSYQQERRRHVGAMIQLALRMGKIMAPRNRVTGFFTRLFFHSLSIYPPAITYIAQMKYRPQPYFHSGFLLPEHDVTHRLVGRLFPQPQVQSAESLTRLDDLTGNRFCLLAWTRDATQAFAKATHPVWQRLNVVKLAVMPDATSKSASVPDVIQARAVDETFANAFHAQENIMVLLRPDHYVVACFALRDLSLVAMDFNTLLERSWPASTTDVAMTATDHATTESPRAASA